jgi:predicted outer membrane protein
LFLRFATVGDLATIHIMSNVAEIEAAITALSIREAEEIREWLEQWLEDQQQMTPEFLASIERGKADIAAGNSRTVSAS